MLSSWLWAMALAQAIGQRPGLARSLGGTGSGSEHGARLSRDGRFFWVVGWWN